MQADAPFYALVCMRFWGGRVVAFRRNSGVKQVDHSVLVIDGLEIRANPLGVLEAGWRKVMDAARLASPERPRNCTIRSASSKSARKDAPFALFVTSFLIGLNRIGNLETKLNVGCKVSAYFSMPPNKRSSCLAKLSRCLRARSTNSQT
jgi:hypothetical protein